MLECVVNISEGRENEVVAALAAAAGADLLDVHLDPDHHRCVLTLLGDRAPRAVTTAAVAALDLGRHEGVHPRAGVVDVVPFVPLDDATPAHAVAARDGFATWAAEVLGLPCHLYGPMGEPTGSGTSWDEWPSQRSLPELRRRVREGAAPDVGPAGAHPSAGVVAVGARGLLVAYNLVLADDDLDLARRVAAAVRSPEIRALAFPVGGRVQVSMNLVDPLRVGPAEAWDAVDELAPVASAELVGLVPGAVLDRTDPARWAALDLDPARTIESRRQAARDGG